MGETPVDKVSFKDFFPPDISALKIHVPHRDASWSDLAPGDLGRTVSVPGLIPPIRLCTEEREFPQNWGSNAGWSHTNVHCKAEREVQVIVWVLRVPVTACFPAKMF